MIGIMKNTNTHSKTFQLKIFLAVATIILAIISFIYPENVYIRVTMQLLLSFVFALYGYERFRAKQWLPFLSFALVSLLNILIVIQALFPNIRY